MNTQESDECDVRRIHWIGAAKIGSITRHCAPMLAAGAALAVTACATVKVEAPEEPIEINLNVNVSGEVRVKLEKEIDDLIAENPDIF